MPIQVQKAKKRELDDDPAAQRLIEIFVQKSKELGLEEAIVYYGYPRYRDAEGDLYTAAVLVASPQHGIALFGTLNTSDSSELDAVDASTDAVFGQLYGKLISNKRLRRSPRTLLFWMDEFIFSPHLSHDPDHETTAKTIYTTGQVEKIFTENRSSLESSTFSEITATIDGSRAIPRPRKRIVANLSPTSKGAQVMRLEVELATFDSKQREGSISEITGPQRIRGLAGSGKTIVLAKKAALNHLDTPDASILYTFWTKSLYQQIRRLITRFYRDEHDRDPDWNHLNVLHGWGGRTQAGVYTLVAKHYGKAPLTYAEASQLTYGDPFDYLCQDLLNSVKIEPMFDYMFIDEGQDYPFSFLQLCSLLVRDGKFVYAYDELQTIFQPRAPSPSEVWGVDDKGEPNVKLERDLILYKCYRNPREILVCAHALGFGIYGEIVQMLENEEHWRDVGYEVESGDFTPGTPVVMRRPEENSLSSISQQNRIDEIIKALPFDSYQEEIQFVVSSIVSDIKDGLRVDDIVVAVVDDRRAKDYLSDIASGLAVHGIRCNNIHATYGAPDFQQDEQVTLTTVHKAKGNEGYVVYVVGADAVFVYPTKRNRNKLFTAMTRAKGWLRVTGTGPAAYECVAEIAKAKQNFPYLRFDYPSPERMETIRRDLDKNAAIELGTERMLDSLTEDELEEYIKKRRRRDKRKGK